MSSNLENLEKLNKQQLLEIIRLLQTKTACESSDVDNKEYLLHELQVHQIELDMQNRELRESQLQLEETRDNYADLFDFAPVNYFTFDNKGVINNLNLTASSLLGKVRANIIGHPFSKWLEKDCWDIFRIHLRAVFQSAEKLSNELRIKDDAGNIIELRIESLRNKSIFIELISL